MSRFMTIKAEEIAEAFETERRQYFVGNLKRPQHIPFVKSETTEMGLTAYDKFTGEPAHRHSVAKEYAYVISGRTQYMDLDTSVCKRVFKPPRLKSQICFIYLQEFVCSVCLASSANQELI